jgi:hypothetical protein|tara:strand:- start:292 stop:675 length:384 start_codon:yes stop_codon:yes gene_type:complete
MVFAFGYFTCRTFYFFKEVRLGLVMLKLSHCLSLYTIVKGVENLEYTKTLRLNELRAKGESERNVNAYKSNFNDEIKLYKDKSIREIVNIHPNFYRDLIKYDSWDTAMQFLNNEGVEFIKKFNQKEQ